LNLYEAYSQSELHLQTDACILNLWWLGELTFFYCKLSCVIYSQGHSGLIACYFVHHKFYSNSIASNFHIMLHIDNPSFSGQAFGSGEGGGIAHRLLSSTNVHARSSQLNQCLCPVLAISCTLTWRFCNTIYLTAQVFFADRAHLQGFFCLEKT